MGLQVARGVPQRPRLPVLHNTLIRALQPPVVDIRRSATNHSCMSPRALLVSGSLVVLGPLGVAAPARASVSGSEATKTPKKADAAHASEKKPTVRVGGALRGNIYVKTGKAAARGRQRGGDFAFDTFRLNVDAGYRSLFMSAEYRFYAGYSMLHHGYIGYRFSPHVDVDIGMSQVPFGLLPFASHNWFFDLPYYLGMEDNYDLGVRSHIELGAVDVRLAFYKNDAGNFTGSSIDSARYSYDVVRTSRDELGPAGAHAPLSNHEVNQGNLRVAYRLDHPLGHTDIGASLEYGGLDNTDTKKMGYHWAVAGHVDAHVGRFDLQVEGIRYRYAAVVPPGQSTAFVVMGAYDAPYEVAASGNLVVLNVAYRIPVQWGPVQAVTVYNDYSALVKMQDSWSNSYQNVDGALFDAGPVMVYLDAALGRNHPWLGASYVTALAAGAARRWEARFNANVGYYF